jgi:hypothetical protein
MADSEKFEDWKFIQMFFNTVTQNMTYSVTGLKVDTCNCRYTFTKEILQKCNSIKYALWLSCAFLSSIDCLLPTNALNVNFITLLSSFSKERSVLPEDGRITETCRS